MPGTVEHAASSKRINFTKAEIETLMIEAAKQRLGVDPQHVVCGFNAFETENSTHPYGWVLVTVE